MCGPAGAVMQARHIPNVNGAAMARIVVSENVSVDGVVQDPTGEEGFGRGGWFGHIADHPEVGGLALDDAVAAEALLLGRRSYEFFGSRWTTRSGRLADRLNALPKYVVSTTLAHPGWGDTTVLDRDPVAAIARLRGELPGDLLVLASFGLVPALIDHQLVDELRLKAFPVVLGAGTRLFGDTAGPLGLRLAESRVVDHDVQYLRYVRER
jgi:dihydrofolate reductase